MERKIQKVFVDTGFGFPVYLLNTPMVKVRGHWTPEIDYTRLQELVLQQLAHKAGRLTGAEIRFIRQAFELTLQQFAKRFGVSHVAVMKWEKAEESATVMGWSSEKDIRMFILSKLSKTSDEVLRLYASLEEVLPSKTVKIQVPLSKRAA